jgi:hypothetical protein
MSSAPLIVVRSLLAALSLFFSTDTAFANWLTIKNDTGKPVVVQEVVTVNGQPRRGKPVPLLAGETIREFLPGPTVKRIEIYDPSNPKVPLASGNLNCPAENQTFSIGVVGGRVTVTPAPQPPKQ